MKSINKYPIKSVSEYLDLLKNTFTLELPLLLFRGQPDDYPLVPKIAREKTRKLSFEIYKDPEFKKNLRIFCDVITRFEFEKGDLNKRLIMMLRDLLADETGLKMALYNFAYVADTARSSKKTGYLVSALKNDYSPSLTVDLEEKVKRYIEAFMNLRNKPLEHYSLDDLRRYGNMIGLHIINGLGREEVEKRIEKALKMSDRIFEFILNAMSEGGGR